jgi:hypothetical protein
VDLDRLLEKPLLKHLRTLAATIRAIIFAGSTFGSGVVLLVLAARYFSVSRGLAVTLGLLFILLTTVAGYAWYYVTHVYDPPFYKIQELHGSLVVEAANGHRKYTYERRQTVVATRNNLRLVEIRGHWTGKGRAGSTVVESIKPEHVMLDGRRPESDGRVHRWIYPRRPLKRGQPVEVGVRQTHEDDVETQLPYFREGGGRYKTERITVTVQLPFDEHVQASVRGVIWDTDHSAQQSEEIGELKVEPRVDSTSRSVVYTVAVDIPAVFHSYGIEWTWSRDSGHQ